MKDKTLFLILITLIAGALIASTQINVITASSASLVSENDNSKELNATATRIEKIGPVYDVIQTSDGYLSLNKSTRGTVIRKASIAGRKIWEKEISYFAIDPVG